MQQIKKPQCDINEDIIRLSAAQFKILDVALCYVDERIFLYKSNRKENQSLKEEITSLKQSNLQQLKPEVSDKPKSSVGPKHSVRPKVPPRPKGIKSGSGSTGKSNNLIKICTSTYMLNFTHLSHLFYSKIWDNGYLIRHTFL